jgi:mRNA-degrading endonuclease RelE of RelBE toxin-antitoxin system
MGYDIKYHRAAEKYLDSQTNATRKRIMDAIDDSTIDVVTIAPRGDVYKK